MEALLRPSGRQTHRDVESGWSVLGWTRRGVGASERAVVECSAGKTYMSYTKDERAGVGGGNNGRRQAGAGERARVWMCLRATWGEAVPSMPVVERRIICRRRRRCRRSGGRRIFVQ